jgi:pyruvate,orthophosphate dikinase
VLLSLLLTLLLTAQLSHCSQHRKAAHSGALLLVRGDTVTSDIEGMAKAAGILTGSSGRTSHAAVVARQLDKVCLVICTEIEIDLEQRQ